jgi:phosphohistidine phosphatase
MLCLIVMRHAKSSWSDKSLDDQSRPLSKRGVKAAPLMGRTLSERRLVPDHVACSPAKRTRETLRLVLGALEAKPSIEYADELYAFGDGGPYLNCIRRQARPTGTLMVVGHNPSVQNLCMSLCSGSRGPDFDSLARKFPTAGVAVISFAVDQWKAIEPGTGSLDLFVTPRGLADGDD